MKMNLELVVAVDLFFLFRTKLPIIKYDEILKKYEKFFTFIKIVLYFEDMVLLIG